MKVIRTVLISSCILLFSTLGLADSIVIHMSLLSNKGPGDSIGLVTATDTPYGLLLTPSLVNLPAGMHGFHIHENPSCENNGKSAGGHFDPNYTIKHLGPYNPKGHLGDLPALMVEHNNKATLPVLAPRLNVADIKGHALVIHLNGDNYSDHPTKNGGGGAMLACGVIH